MKPHEMVVGERYVITKNFKGDGHHAIRAGRIVTYHCFDYRSSSVLKHEFTDLDGHFLQWLTDSELVFLEKENAGNQGLSSLVVDFLCD